jgi:hypothetical protein
MQCAICGTELKKDLFAAVTGEKVCSICKIRFIGGLPTTVERIAKVRNAFGLEEGQFISLDRGEEARRILGH